MKWRIGDWIACTDTDTVCNGSVQKKLERRAMEALVVLAGRAGQVVRKDEFIEIVWGRHAVSDHSVAMVISQLRRAFKDDARSPRYIETITKRGYRLIVPCEPIVEVAARGVERGSIALQPQMGVVLASAGVAMAGLGTRFRRLFSFGA
jgi:DNA-binding winged helix-turn-helix (wHTH) protein